MEGFTENSHTRFNPLTGEWVLVSPHRSKRPWLGQTEDDDTPEGFDYDPNCYLCPGNERIGGTKNQDYESVFAFDNDFAALQNDILPASVDNGLIQAKSEKGVCRVICFSPKHNLTIPELDNSQVRAVINVWVDECLELGSDPEINHIQIFENKGSVMGCSNPHPHGQIWAQNSIPVEPKKKHKRQLDYYKKLNSLLVLNYLEQELDLNQRIVYQNRHFVALVPFWAVWPFETMIIPRRAMSQIIELTDEEKDCFADAYRVLTIKYDNLFKSSFPYSAGIHQAPYNGKKHDYWQWHMSFYPPLLRSSTIKKFMVGYEMFANAQRDITAEQASRQLRDASMKHYKQ